MKSNDTASLPSELGLHTENTEPQKTPHHGDFVPTEILLGALLGFAFPTGLSTPGKHSHSSRKPGKTK